MKLIIPGRLADLNTYINAERRNKYAAANIKEVNTDICCLYAKVALNKGLIVPCTRPVRLVFTWYCKNMKIDKDNRSYAKKFVLDGLVKAGVLKQDGWKQLADDNAFIDNFKVDKNERVEVEIIELED